MKKADLEKLNLEMARFLMRLCRDSDTYYGGRRTDRVEINYKKSLRFIRRCGLKYPALPSDHTTK